jgi:hypothetical protein
VRTWWTSQIRAADAADDFWHGLIDDLRSCDRVLGAIELGGLAAR